VLRVSPLQRRNSPESVADVFLFLVSPMANEMTGHKLFETPKLAKVIDDYKAYMSERV